MQEGVSIDLGGSLPSVWVSSDDWPGLLTLWIMLPSPLCDTPMGRRARAEEWLHKLPSHQTRIWGVGEEKQARERPSQIRVLHFPLATDPPLGQCQRQTG